MKTHLSLPTRFEMEDFNEIEKFIHDYAKQNSDGFTISIILENDSIILQKTTRGKVAAYAETQDSFDMDGLKICLSHALKNGLTIGGWLDDADNRFYFDSVKVFESELEAVSFGLQQNQIAIFDLDELKEIRL